ncbi:hypothetical protein PYW07_004181 [Mythimna separata]|uniref:Uncharacterized protein n=1 Tax=Mythimna separata TaxID=271217 RepID=A0AAD8DUU7_MYTSE|nr:hypothetical protein PYW07_004181 [Mythimna separata]
MKMVPPHRIPTLATLILLLLLQPTLEAKESKRKVICPIGFQITYSNIDGKPLCYRLKGPERLTDKYVGCTGNLYTYKLYNSLNMTKSELVLWTEYKSLYRGGPFIDYSFTKSTGSLLESTFEVDNPQKSIEEELCVVVDPVSNFTATRCDDEFYRYCLVKPYVDEDSMSKEGCDELSGSWRFWSPKATCLIPAIPIRGGAVRATWLQAKEICEKKGGTVLYNGWRYSNNPLLHISGSLPVYPLGITYDPQRHSHIVNEDATTPPAEWGLEDTIEMVSGNETSYGAIRNDIWELVNSSYVFYDVICEKNVDLRKVEMVVSADEQNKLILTVGDDVDKENIYCFTDSETFSPTPVKISFDDIHNKILSYVLKPIGDGYYWCVHIDSKKYLVSESNKALWIREEQSLRYNFAVKLTLKKEYRFDTVEALKKTWKEKLREYIFYSTNYYKINGGLEQIQDPKTFEGILRNFKSAHPDLNPKDKDVLYGLKVKKIFLDGKTVVLHLNLNPRMKPVQPATWDGIEIIYMKPVYYCTTNNHEFVESITVQCQIHTCVGNFNDGVQVVTTIDENCSQSTLVPTAYYPGILTSRSGRKPPNAIDKLQMDTSDSNSDETTTTFTPSPPPETIATESDIGNTTASNSTVGGDNATITTSIITAEPPTDISTSTITTTTDDSSDETVTETTSETATTVFKTTTTPEPVITEIPIIIVPTVSTPAWTAPPTPPPPSEQLQQVMDELQSLIDNETVPLLVEDIKTAFDQVDGFLEENVDLSIPGELLHLLDGIGSRLDLGDSENATTIRSNIALLVTNADPKTPVKGLRIAARENDTFVEGAFEILRDEFDTANLQLENSEAVVKLPDSVATSSRRISFVVFRNDRAFHTKSPDDSYVNSRVLSVNVENVTEFDKGESVDIHFSSIGTGPGRNQSRACAYWHFLEGGQGYWSQEGCVFIRATRPGVLDTCRCTHLTHFAEILVPRAVFSEANEQALEILSLIGCCLSMFGLVVIGITAALFRSWRRDFSNKIWLQLCISILILMICFIVIVFAKFEHYGIPCMLVGVLLHYSVLASFCWMLVAAVLSYRRLVLVFSRDASHKLLRASAFSWGVPCAIVGILLSVAPHSYAGRFEEKTPTGAFCYPSGLGLWLGVYAPIAVMLLANWTLFVLIVRSVFATNRTITRHGDTNEAVRCASVSCLLVFLFGLPWIFGLFAYNLVLAYLFALTATFQGFVLFIFFVVGNKKTRDLWLNKLKIKQTRKIPVTSSTYTNRSTGPGFRGAPQSSVEAKVSKPRSLSTPDDSRFS